MFRLSCKALAALTGIAAAALMVTAFPAGQLNAAGTANEKEYNDSILTANPISADTQIFGVTADGGDVDFYKITLPSAGCIHLTLSTCEGDGRVFKIFDSNENELTSDGMNQNNKVDRNFTKGTYYLKVSPRWGSSGNYSFYYRFESSEESFVDTGKDNVMGGANYVELNKTYKGQLAHGDEDDWFKFNVPGPGNLIIDFDSACGIWNQIIDTKENPIYKPSSWNNHYGQTRLTIHFTAAGTYYLQLNRTGDYGNYSFTMAFNNISLSATASVVCGNAIDLSVENNGDSSVTWKTSDSRIANVNEYGRVTGIKAGPATIYATVDGKTLQCKVQVLYKDVANSKEYWYTPTNYLTNWDVVKGYDNQTTFQPQNNCTRAQMVTFLWRLKGSPKPNSTKTSFKDVKKSAYYYKAVLWAVEKGITTGYSKTKFKPNNVCTRAQTVTFLWRMAGKPKAANVKNKFKDIAKSDYFYNAVLWASGKNIVAGYKNKTFRPQNKCTRAQMVTFLYKYSQNVK